MPEIRGKEYLFHLTFLTKQILLPIARIQFLKILRVPLILSNKKAYIVCSSNANLSANWTWMGVRYDNGGLYVPPARAFGRINVEISIEGEVRKRLPNFVASCNYTKMESSTQGMKSLGCKLKEPYFCP